MIERRFAKKIITGLTLGMFAAPGVSAHERNPNATPESAPTAAASATENGDFYSTHYIDEDGKTVNIDESLSKSMPADDGVEEWSYTLTNDFDAASDAWRKAAEFYKNAEDTSKQSEVAKHAFDTSIAHVTNVLFPLFEKCPHKGALTIEERRQETGLDFQARMLTASILGDSIKEGWLAHWAKEAHISKQELNAKLEPLLQISKEKGYKDSVDAIQLIIERY